MFQSYYLLISNMLSKVGCSWGCYIPCIPYEQQQIKEFGLLWMEQKHRIHVYSDNAKTMLDAQYYKQHAFTV